MVNKIIKDETRGDTSGVALPTVFSTGLEYLFYAY